MTRRAGSLELAAQLRGGFRADVVVVSVATNDAAPWKRVPLPDFERASRDDRGYGVVLPALAQAVTATVATSG